jgi:hypothetical protein
MLSANANASSVCGKQFQTAREMAPAKDALWLQRSLPDDA